MPRLSLLLTAIFLVGCSREAPPPTEEVPTSVPASSSSAASETAAPLTGTYADPSGRFTLAYPEGWRLKMDAEWEGVSGIAIMFPAEETQTVFSEASLYVTSGERCPPLQGTVSASEVIDEIPFLRSAWSDAAAGNLYQGETWMGSREGTCYVLTAVMHSCNLGPDCAPGHTAPFDKAVLLSAFEQTIRSLSFP